MVLYVVYRASRESKDRSLLPKRLRALGCKRIHRSFWRIDENKINKVLKVLENNQPIILRRTREVRKPGFLGSKGMLDLGSLIVVMYAVPKGFNREKVQIILRSAPCIRLSRSIYAFPQRPLLFDKEKKLVDALEFTEFIKEIYEDVKTVSRIVVVDSTSIERLVEETRERVEDEISSITECWVGLYSKALNGEDRKIIGDLFVKNRRRFLKVRRIAAFYEKWLRLDFSKSMMRSYRARRRIQSQLRKEQGTPVDRTRSVHK